MCNHVNKAHSDSRPDPGRTLNDYANWILGTVQFANRSGTLEKSRFCDRCSMFFSDNNKARTAILSTARGPVSTWSKWALTPGVLLFPRQCHLLRRVSGCSTAMLLAQDPCICLRVLDPVCARRWVALSRSITSLRGNAASSTRSCAASHQASRRLLLFLLTRTRPSAFLTYFGLFSARRLT